MENDKEHPRVLIEEWFPFEDIGIECKRERIGTFAPPNRLHIWWARRPLIGSRAAIVGSIISPDLTEDFNKIIQIEKDLSKKMKAWEKLKSEGKTPVGISSSRAFTKDLEENEKGKMRESILKIWKKEEIRFLDPMAGGGNIPFEAIRLGLDVKCSDLNPISVILLYSTLYYPIKFGKPLIPKIRAYAEKILKETSKISDYYPMTTEKEFFAFLWVRTINCSDPNCNLKVPLSPNWNLSAKPRIIIKLIIPKDLSDTSCKFKLIENPTNKHINNNPPTVKRGIGTCPRCKNTLTSDYIKKEAQSGRMDHQLMALSYKQQEGKKLIKKFRAPNDTDLKPLNTINKFIEEKLKIWKEKAILPDEEIKMGAKTRELLNKGIDKWYKLFNNRQLFANLAIFEEIISLKTKLLKDSTLDLEEIKAIITYLQLAFDKMIDRNSIQTRWVPTYKRITNTFDRHDFGFKWSYAEMDVIRKGYKWAISDVLKVYEELVGLLKKSKSSIEIAKKPAQALDHIPNSSVDVIVVDPPYYDNVMYAELSDYFYVWMKRCLGDIYPEIFESILTDKDNEAVANPSRFEGLGTSKSKLAKQDYESKMEKSFKEMYRILENNGVLTIMFTHKSTDAWDTLAMSLMEAGFEITASWPVHTEADLSLHIAKKNAVKTTIFLVCRKRKNRNLELWWEDDVLPSIKKVVTNKAKEFRKLGIDGVDLFISCFGPALKEFSKSYPVRSISGDLIRAEEAIEAARKVVIDITLQDIIKGKSYNIDPVSKFYLTAWHFFRARVFPFDEARRLAISIGINIDDLKTSYKLLNKKSGDVIMLLPKEREKNGIINVDNPKDNGILINAVHTAILAYEEGGQKLFENVVEKLRRNTDKSFRLYMETLFNVLPDVKDLATNLPEKKILGEILMTTEEKITPKGGKITDFIDE